MRSDLAIWLLGVAFLVMGAVIGSGASRLVLTMLEWSDAITTTGRVIATEWERQGQDNRFKVSFAYKDEHGTIFHTTSILPRRPGKLSLQPGAAVVVVYKPLDHADARLAAEVGQNQGWQLAAVAAVEIAAAFAFLAVATRRLWNWLALNRRGMAVFATVSALEDGPLAIGGRRLKKLVCQFADRDGRMHTAVSPALSEEAAQRYPVGSSVKVLFLPERPSVSLVDLGCVAGGSSAA